MTAKDAYERLEKLISDGHGDKRIGYFDHEYGHFTETVEINVTKDGGHFLPGGLKENEEVVEIC